MGLVRRRSGSRDTSERRFRDRSKDDLLEQIRSPEPNERRWAARDLAEYAETMPMLCDCLEREPDESVRVAILTALLKQRSPEIAQRLSGLLSSEDAGLRSAVGEVLSEMPDQLSLMLETLLRHQDSDVRILAVTAVARLAHPMVPDCLLNVAERDVHPNVVAAALEGLGECGTPEMITRVEAVAARFPGNAYLSFVVSATAGLMGRHQ
jgi:HEAT repeat protein